jgi:hypothetical protein
MDIQGAFELIERVLYLGIVLLIEFEVRLGLGLP